MSSSSQMRSCTTSSAWPSIVASNVSSPSRFVREGQTVAENGQTCHHVRQVERNHWTRTLKHIYSCKSSVTQEPTTTNISSLHPTSCCLGDAFEVPLEDPSHCHGSNIHKVLQTHVINATSGQDNVRARGQNLLDPFLGDVRFSGATFFFLVSTAKYVHRIKYEYRMSSPQYWHNSSDGSCGLDSGCWYFIPRVSQCKLLVQHHSKCKWDCSKIVRLWQCKYKNKSIHLCLIWSSFSGSLMMTWTPIFILVFCRLKSKQAILALATRFTMPFGRTQQQHA